MLRIVSVVIDVSRKRTLALRSKTKSEPEHGLG
jgi:hypothetical protein